MKRNASLSLLALFLVAGAAMAAGQTKPATTPQSTIDHSQMQHKHMDHMDHGKTGQHGGASDEFATLDADKSGRLSQAELAKHRLAPHFGMLDANRDGSLTQAEFAAGRGM